MQGTWKNVRKIEGFLIDFFFLHCDSYTHYIMREATEIILWGSNVVITCNVPVQAGRMYHKNLEHFLNSKVCIKYYKSIASIVTLVVYFTIFNYFIWCADSSGEAVFSESQWFQRVWRRNACLDNCWETKVCAGSKKAGGVVHGGQIPLSYLLLRENPLK